MERPGKKHAFHYGTPFDRGRDRFRGYNAVRKKAPCPPIGRLSVPTLVIAEKPSVAKDLARVLGARGRGDGCFEGGGWRVAWCVGHLLELAPPESYDAAWKRWAATTLPMLPETFQLQPRKGATKQLVILKRLLAARDVERVVNACDAGREGELIFRWVWQHAFGARRGPPVERLWVASLTDEAVREAFRRLRPGAAYDALGAAARCRSEADWLVGLNATRAMTLAGRRGGGDAGLLSVGRVQTPTLAMLTAREDAIEQFVPEPYWQVAATFETAAGAGWTGLWHDGRTDRITDPDGAARAAAIADATRPGPGRVATVERDEMREKAPALFDLTALQKLANQRFGMSADRTLKAAQALYEEHKAITYPRTDSRFITRDMLGGLEALLRAQAGQAWGDAVDEALRLGPRPQRRIADDAEVGDHHAILPTAKVPDVARLGVDERRVWELIARRFVAVFLPDATFDRRRVTVHVGPHAFVAEGRTRTALGWHRAEPPPPARDEVPLLPDVAVGEVVGVKQVDVKRKETQPPKRFTEATLLGAMEHAGRDLDTDELRRAMRESGLGTPATRAAIIETLLTRNYIRRDGKVLVPTPSGRALISALPVAALKSAELTGQWEARLVRMAEGREDPAAFMAEIRGFTAEAVRAMLGAAPAKVLADAHVAAASVGRCPLCGGEVRGGGRGYRCGAAGCGFSVPAVLAGRALSEKLVAVLLSRRRTVEVKGFRSKAGKRFSAALVLGEDGRIGFDFGRARESGDSAEATAEGTATRPRRTRSAGGENAEPSRAPRKTRARAGTAADDTDPRPRCPKCGTGRVMAGRAAWGCTRWREGCDFVVSFVQQGYRIPDDEAERLFRKKSTRLMTGLVADGRAKLVLDLGAPGHVRIERARKRGEHGAE
jgi:DNA topoisomerase-3